MRTPRSPRKVENTKYEIVYHFVFRTIAITSSFLVGIGFGRVIRIPDKKLIRAALSTHQFGAVCDKLHRPKMAREVPKSNPKKKPSFSTLRIQAAKEAKLEFRNAARREAYTPKPSKPASPSGKTVRKRKQNARSMQRIRDAKKVGEMMSKMQPSFSQTPPAWSHYSRVCES